MSAHYQGYIFTHYGFVISLADMNAEKLAKMAGTVRTGGKGTVRRKKKAVHKTNSTDEKKLQTQLKRLGVNTIPGIEEVLLFNEDDTALSFTNPKVQASIAANTYVVSGTSQQKTAQEAMASMIGPNAASIQQLMAQMGMQGGIPGLGGMGGDDEDEEEDDDDDDVPELVGNFDQPE